MTHTTDLSEPLPAADLAPAEIQAHARELWRRSGGRMTGAELAAHYGRSERYLPQPSRRRSIPQEGLPVGWCGRHGSVGGPIDTLYGELLERGSAKGRGRLSPRTVRYLHTILRKALSDAVRKDMLIRNVAELVTPPSHTAARAPEFQAWTPVELRFFLASVAEHTHGAMFRLLGLGGLRRGEACGLRWTDVDLEKGSLVVRHTLDTYGHVMPGQQADAAAAVADLVDGTASDAS
jgi:integrase